MALPILRLNAKLEGELEHGRRRFSVPFALPGDLVQFRLGHRKKKKLQVLHIERAESYDPELPLVEPFCKYFSECGGCRGQHLNYACQLDLKCAPVERRMKEDFGLSIKRIAAPRTQGHRHRMDFVVELGENGTPIIGQRPAGDYAHFVDLESCPVQGPLANDLLSDVRGVLAKHPKAAFRRDSEAGTLKYVTIRASEYGGLVILTVVGEQRNNPDYEDFVKDLTSVLQKRKKLLADKPDAKTSLPLGLVESSVDSKTEVSAVAGGQALLGNSYYTERLGGLFFEVPYDGFFQPNPEAFDLLLDFCLESLRDLAPIPGQLAAPRESRAPHGALLDLYCGAGVLSQIFLNRYPGAFCSVWGFDSTESAIRSARRSFSGRDIEHTFEALDLNRLSDSFKERVSGLSIGLVLMDPPRAGISKALRKFLARELLPPRILYVSCNPATQFQDLQAFRENYSFKAGCLVDCYPQTAHLEQAVLLERKDL